MRFEAKPYEVRCARCDVSFPVGTRRCIHCGGPTGDPARLFGEGTVDVRDVQDMVGYSTTSNEPIIASAESPFSMGGSGLGDASPNDRELEIPDEPSSIGRTLIRSLGGIIWILLLIGFSLARDCGD